MNYIAQEQLYTVLLAPHVSEKATLLADTNRQFVFKVAKYATKHMIKCAVEKMFSVKVKSVTLCVVKGKTKRFAQRQGRRSDYKKAYVTLVSGDIDFSNLPKSDA